MTVVEFGEDVLVIDCGLAFPEDDMLGIDLVIPDMSYLYGRKEKLRAILLTHGHEDHVGGMPFLLREVKAPVYGSRLTLGMVERKLGEHNLRLPPESRPFTEGERLRLGCFEVEPFAVTHSIPGALGFAIHTPEGTIVFTGDFKFDLTPVGGEVSDFATLVRLGREGVLALFCDSTNAERVGFTPSERTVGGTIERIVREAPGRVLVTTFASNVHRIQQVMDVAVGCKRRVAVVGRSMENTVQVSTRLGYLHVPDGLLLPTEAVNRTPPERVIVLTTGSQGEPMSALSRMASGEHRQVDLIPGDTVILAATPVPGNEKMVHRTIDNLYRMGARVIYQREAGVHVSGHANREELKLMMTLVQPKWFIPVHGEYRHLIENAAMAREIGVADDHVLVGENGTNFEFSGDGCRVAGKVAAGAVLVDGLGVGDVGNVVMRDRRLLAEEGILVVSLAIRREDGAVVGGPDIASRGFVYMRDSEDLMEEARARVLEVVSERTKRNGADLGGMRQTIRDALGQFVFEKVRRRPVVLPLFVEVD